MSGRDPKLSLLRGLESSVLADVVERMPRPMSEDELVALASEFGSSPARIVEVRQGIENLVSVGLLERYGEALTPAPAGKRATELKARVATPLNANALRENLRANVKALREQKGWSQAELAKRSGLSPRAVSDLENGRTEDPRVKTLISLKFALGTSLESLYDDPVNQ